MKRRTQAQIEKDCKLIKEAASIAKNFKEIEELTGLTYQEIIVSLKKHPIVFDRIKKQMGLSQCETTQDKAVVKEEQYIVIDASIASTPKIEDILKAESRKIILTSVTVKELSQMQHFSDGDAMRARHLLLMAAEDDKKFVHKLINEDLETADKCILDYCIKNKKSVTLFTADKEMYNFAKIYSVPAKFFKTPMEGKRRSTVVEFGGLNKIGPDLIIDLDHFNTSKKLVTVISGEQQLSEGIVKLKIGDEILLASQKNDYVTFAHYKVISLWAKENCTLLFSKRLNDLDKLNFNCQYKSFLREFKRKIA